MWGSSAEAPLSAAEQNLPIDIHANKLLDFLVDRRKVPSTWRKSVVPIRNMIEAAIQDLPETQGIKSLMNTFSSAVPGQQHPPTFNYFHALRMVDLLKQSGEPETKTLFGSFTSKRMQAWADILKAYEKDDVYLGEASNEFVNMIQYDIPALRKAIDRHAKAATDLDRRAEEHRNSADSHRKRYTQETKSMGVHGGDARAQILSLTTSLPQYFEQVTHMIKSPSFKMGVDYYASFTRFIFSASGASPPSEPDTILQCIHQIINEDATPLVEMPEQSVSALVISSPAPLEIDWSIVDGPEGATGGLDPTDEAPSQVIPLEISWEDEGNGEIDWGAIEVADAGAIEIVASDEQADSKRDTKEDGDNSPNSIFETSETRTRVMNELYLLKAFLLQRMGEMESGGESLGLALDPTQTHSAPEIVQAQTASSIRAMLELVDGALGILGGKKVKSLLEIKSSSAYVDRLVSGLQQHLDQAARQDVLAHDAEIKRDQERAWNAATYPTLEAMTARAKAMATDLEGAVSRLYRNRPTNIMLGNL
eukprot:TRINITY_DN2215_c0_g1_i3.p1 TRINITY_DN2215_c0_g1~~TRINITY_DN2215_c0_g1_i3.p1  ORF type:complete len:536 (+),score=118.55 TRINITY_DN2215_c0_g1_i3:36-1643(+)